MSVLVDKTAPSTAAIHIAENGVAAVNLGETSARGEGAIINLPPGYLTLTARSAEAGTIMRYRTGR